MEPLPPTRSGRSADKGPGRPRLSVKAAAQAFRRHYGAGPFHLLGLLASFAFTGYVCSLVAQVPAAEYIGAWFVGAVVVHDLILWPLYALGDRTVVAVAARLHARSGSARVSPSGAGSQRQTSPVGPARRVPWVNHVRVPVVLSGLLLVVSFPLVLNRSGRTYQAATGLSPSPYTARWLAVTAVLFGASVTLYAARLLWARLATVARPARGRSA